MTKKVIRINEATIRFAGDSGDGMQLTGTRFTEATAIVGNDLKTIPNYPSEIRAPLGTLAGAGGDPNPPLHKPLSIVQSVLHDKAFPEVAEVSPRLAHVFPPPL